MLFHGSKVNSSTVGIIQQSMHSYKGRYILVVSYSRAVGSTVNCRGGGGVGGRGTNHPKWNFLRTLLAQNVHYGCEVPPPDLAKAQGP